MRPPPPRRGHGGSYARAATSVATAAAAAFRPPLTSPTHTNALMRVVVARFAEAGVPAEGDGLPPPSRTPPSPCPPPAPFPPAAADPTSAAGAPSATGAATPPLAAAAATAAVEPLVAPTVVWAATWVCVRLETARMDTRQYREQNEHFFSAQGEIVYLSANHLRGG